MIMPMMIRHFYEHTDSQISDQVWRSGMCLKPMVKHMLSATEARSMLVPELNATL